MFFPFDSTSRGLGWIQEFGFTPKYNIFQMKYELRLTKVCGYFLFLLQVNQKMTLTLAASIMYWSLQQSAEDTDFPSPAATTTTTPDASPAPSVSGEDENSSLGGEFSNLSMDDATSDTTVSSQLEYEVSLVGEEP